MATISACAVGSLSRVTWLVPVAITTPSLTTRAANGPPSRRTQTTAISMACLMNELDIRPGPRTQDGQGCQRISGKERRKFIDRKSTRLNSSHRCISHAGFCLIKKQPFTWVITGKKMPQYIDEYTRQTVVISRSINYVR